MKDNNEVLPPPRVCACVGCVNPIVFSIHFSLAVHDKHPPAVTTPVLYVCEEHKNEFTFEKLTPPESWKSLCDMFTSAGMQAPKKSYSRIILMPVTPEAELN